MQRNSVPVRLGPTEDNVNQSTLRIELPEGMKLATNIVSSPNAAFVFGRSMGDAKVLFAADPVEGYTPLPNLPFKRATAFDAPSGATPLDLFTHLASEHTPTRCHDTAHRFVRRTNDREMLIYVDGSCLDQNSSEHIDNRRAGCAWVYKPEAISESHRLELKGPTGEEQPQTSNRAELRAALGALTYRRWFGEGWERVVIATGSEYVALGITQRIETWAARGWRTGSRSADKNKDLWKALRDKINELGENGTEVVFWRIPREQNTIADQAAKNAAVNKPALTDFTPFHGIIV